jgi:hypothetical protein
LAYDLVAIAGPLEGERFVLESGKETPIGRSPRGINLPDPMVSVSHARLFEDGADWFVEDLGSATGTKVNGTALTPKTRYPLQIGDVLAIGESQLRIDSQGNRVLRRLMWAMVPAWLLVFGAAATLYWVSGEGPVSLALGKTVRTTTGATSALIVPHVFIREHALDVPGLALRRVTDFDGDQVDELWLYHGPDELAITFVEGGGWRLLGRFPKGCVDREGEGLPDLICQGITYRMMDDGTYRAVAQTEPVVWLRGTPAGQFELEKPKEPKEKAKKSKKAKKAEEEAAAAGGAKPADGPVQVVEATRAMAGAQGPVPYRMSLGSPDKLAGFLAARGIGRGVHYILCEGAFPGVGAQAVLEGGEVVSLGQTCGDDVKLEGPQAKGFEGVSVVGVALTAAGREALPRHLAYAWSGNPGDLFLDDEQRAIVRTMGGWPTEVIGGVLLGWDAPEHFFVPFASEATLSDRVGLITETPRPNDAIMASLLSRGRAELDPEGCAKLVVRTHPFRCATLRGCLPGKTFLEVREIGCGEERVLVRTGYGAGVWDGSSEAVDVRVELETAGGMAVTDVIRARVGVRPR